MCSKVFCIQTCGCLVNPGRQGEKKVAATGGKFQYLLGEFKGPPDLAQLGGHRTGVAKGIPFRGKIEGQERLQGLNLNGRGRRAYELLREQGL